MAAAERYVTGDQLIASEFNKLIDMTHMNVIRNSRFDSWDAQTGALNPDGIACGWYHQNNGGSIAREATIVHEGKYSCKVSKNAGDPASTTISQSLTPLFKNNYSGNDWVARARAYAENLRFGLNTWLQGHSVNIKMEYARLKTRDIRDEIRSRGVFTLQTQLLF